MAVFALIDCNNFYVSCERAFNPELENKPIVVLSNNDGCIIARSEEAKKLKIPMGQPFYKAKHLCKKHDIKVFSSNYQLYGDMSQRVMQIIKDFVPDVEIYSIDEAFVRLDTMECDPQRYADLMRYLRQKIKLYTGIPVSIGIANTKTLAKIANNVIKRNPYCHVLDIRNENLQKCILSSFAVEDIWGVGRKWAEKLKIFNINTAEDFKNTEVYFIRKQFTVVGERILKELQGISCIDLEQVQTRKNIMSSKSFGKGITKLSDIEKALSNYVVRAACKLRHQRGRAQGLYVYLRTNKFNTQILQYNNYAVHNFLQATNDTIQIIKEAKELARKIYKEGFVYKKAGIILTDIISDNILQGDLFVEQNSAKNQKIADVVEKINSIMGKNTTYYAAQGIKRPWEGLCDHRSPFYTTSWKELPVVGY